MYGHLESIKKIVINECIDIAIGMDEGDYFLGHSLKNFECLFKQKIEMVQDCKIHNYGIIIFSTGKNELLTYKYAFFLIFFKAF